MLCQVKDFIEIMESIAPEYLAEPWDNIGLLIGSSKAPVKRVMITLDVTADVINHAVETKCDLIISHHPVIFQPIKEVNDITQTGSYILKLAEAGICVYSAHTNFDKAKGGVDDVLAKISGLNDIKPLIADYGSDCTGTPGYCPSIGRIGRLEEKMTLKDYLKKVKKSLSADTVDYIGDPLREIQLVASVAGAGGDFIKKAQEAGADLFITGEAKYHETLQVLDGNMALAVFGHGTTEIPAMMDLKRRLQKKIHELQWDIDIVTSKMEGNYFRRIKE
ncbi:MAG: Nif3-like dinuclear metal center hexameric protein [Caldicoprobacterales bacterium]